MANISAKQVKDLRARTGAGMMDCKAALAECGGDMEASIDWLRQKGHAKMAKKAGRDAKEGLIALCIKGDKGALVELSSETDFVARNESFEAAANLIAQQVLAQGEDLSKIKIEKISVEDYVKDLATKLGENISLKRARVLSAPAGGSLAAYIHNKQGDNTGKIGVLVALAKGEGDVGRQVAMHISAARPLAISTDDIDKEVIARERSVLLAQAQEEGKPAEVAQKMVEGRLKKFYKETALLEQEFVLDDDLTIGKLLDKEKASVSAFACFALGED